MPLTEMVVTVAAFAGMLLAAIHLLRLVGLAITHGTVRKAIDRNPDAADSLLAQLNVPTEEKGDDRTAIMLIAFGVAMVVATLAISDPEWVRYGIAGAVFPLFIGTALWLRHYALNRSRRTDRAEQQ